MFRVTLFGLTGNHTKVCKSIEDVQQVLANKISDPKDKAFLLNWFKHSLPGSEYCRRLQGFKVECISEAEASILPIKERYDWRDSKTSNNARSIICSTIRSMQDEMKQNQNTLRELQSRFSTATPNDKKEIQRVANELNKRIKDLDKEIGAASAFLHRD